MSIRKMIDNYRKEIMDSESLTIDRASQMLVELSALIGNINDEVLDLSQVYSQKQLDIVDKEGMSIAKSNVYMQTTQEWKDLERAKGYKEVTLELIRGLKYRCRALGEEYQVSSNL